MCVSEFTVTSLHVHPEGGFNRLPETPFKEQERIQSEHLGFRVGFIKGSFKFDPLLTIFYSLTVIYAESALSKTSPTFRRHFEYGH